MATCQIMVMTNYNMRAGMMYQLEGEREGNISDHGCDHKTRAGKTYSLEVEKEGNVSDHDCDYKQG
jgi:hypothetical protein